MEKEIIISDDEYETRCAVLEDGVLTEIDIERKNDEHTLNNTYKRACRKRPFPVCRLPS